MATQKKSRLLKLAVYPFLILKQIANLPRTYSDLVSLRREFAKSNYEASTALHDVKKLKKRSTDDNIIAKRHLESLDQRVADLLHQLTIISERLSTAPKANTTKNSGDLMADEHLLDNFYVHFEKWFRGSEAEIKRRQLIYLPYFKNAKINSQKFPVLDIGCGNGEFLQIMKDNKIRAIGLDLNKKMVANAKTKGLEAIQTDALSYLRKQKSGSLMCVTGFHIVEHIPFLELIKIFNECYRTLKPGGFVIFETPNPENVIVATNDFYHDPSHLKPLPPEFLKLAIKSPGFNNAEIKRIFPIKKIKHEDPLVQEIANRMYGPQNYAVIAWK